MVRGLPPTTDVQGAAAIAGCKPHRILVAIRSGDLDAARLGRAYVIPTRAVTNWINAAAKTRSRERRAIRCAPPTRGPDRGRDKRIGQGTR